MARPSPEVAPTTTATRPLRSNKFAMLVRNLHRAVVLRIGPPFVRNNRRPARTGWILIVGIISQAFIQLAILAELFAIEFDAQAGPFRHGDRAVLVAHQAALNHVVHQMMIMRVGSEGK